MRRVPNRLGDFRPTETALPRDSAMPDPGNEPDSPRPVRRGGRHSEKDPEWPGSARLFGAATDGLVSHYRWRSSF